MNRHLRDKHSEPSVQTSDSSELETYKGIESIKGIGRNVEIPQQSSNGGPRKTNSTAIYLTVKRLMSMSAVGLSRYKTATRMRN